MSGMVSFGSDMHSLMYTCACTRTHAQAHAHTFPDRKRKQSFSMLSMQFMNKLQNWHCYLSVQSSRTKADHLPACLMLNSPWSSCGFCVHKDAQSGKQAVHFGCVGTSHNGPCSNLISPHHRIWGSQIDTILDTRSSKCQIEHLYYF